MPLSAAATTANQSCRILIPDCCNIGVVFRTLIGVNALALGAKLMTAVSWRTGVKDFVEASMLVELACLWSLFALCALRHVLIRRALLAALPAWAQRLSCVLLPALVTATVVHLFTSTVGLPAVPDSGLAGKAAFTAAVLGAMFQHYFELRSQAFSPALVEARLQALQARIRPHFLFNSLNAALSLIRTEPRRAETTLEDLADLFRVLMTDPRSMSSLEDEIRLCEQYLSIEKIRLGERLQVRWDYRNLGEDVLRKARIPVLLLQPLIENAVHYGVEPSVEPVEVLVQVSRSIDRIEIVVLNPYHATTTATPGNHIALENIRERLALLYDLEAQLTTTIANGFFEVRMRFPYVRSAA